MAGTVAASPATAAEDRKAFDTLRAQAALQGYACPKWSGPMVYLLERQFIGDAGSDGGILYRFGKYMAFASVEAASAWLAQRAGGAS